MIIVSEHQLKAIEEAALSVYPNEMCGFLTRDGFIRCENKADNPASEFRIDAVDYAKHHDKIVAVVHTHVPPRRYSPLDPRTPSYTDVIVQRKSGIPWLIYACDGRRVGLEPVQLPRAPNPNYLNRPFIWWINDCYSIVQDYYRFELGIILPEHKIDVDHTNPTHMNDLFAGHIELFGFRETDVLDGIKNGDLLLLSNGGFRHNHLGIYHDGQVIHQLQLSVSQPLSDFYGRISKVLKYEG